MFTSVPSPPSWFYQQSGVIPYRRGDSPNELEVLLITSRGRGRWIIPKGVIDPGETPIDSAQREALEEAGIEGKSWATALGEYQYKKWGGTCVVEVFALEVTKTHDAWPESNIRRRQWMSVKKAAEAVEESGLKKLILKVLEL